MTRDLDSSEQFRYDAALTGSMSALRENGEYRYYRSVPQSAALNVSSWLTPYFGDTDTSGYNLTLFFNTDVASGEPYLPRVFVDSVLHVLRYVREKGLPVFVPSSEIVHPGVSSQILFF